MKRIFPGRDGRLGRPALGVVAAVAALLFLPGCFFANPFYYSPKSWDEFYYADTNDGWQIAVYHYKPKESRYDPNRDPVILCHGLACNSYFWHLDKSVDFPKYLADRGYDVWMLDLRGVNRSRRKTEIAGFQGMDVRGADPNIWSVDDYALRDVPAVIDLVKKKTGKKQVNWIGHSMGGMIMYVFLERGSDPKLNVPARPDSVKNFVAVGSPLTIPPPPNDLLAKESKNLEGTITLLELVNLRTPIRVLGAGSAIVHTNLDLLYYNEANISGGVRVKAYVNMVDNINPGVFRQFIGMIDHDKGHFRSKDGKYDYVAELPAVKTPILLLAANVDPLAPPTSVLAAYYNVSSEDKEYREFTRVNGYDVDYGHCDLIFGRTAPKEVWPYILDWLGKRA